MIADRALFEEVLRRASSFRLRPDLAMIRMTRHPLTPRHLSGYGYEIIAAANEATLRGLLVGQPLSLTGETLEFFPVDTVLIIECDLRFPWMGRTLQTYATKVNGFLPYHIVMSD